MEDLEGMIRKKREWISFILASLANMFVMIFFNIMYNGIYSSVKKQDGWEVIFEFNDIPLEGKCVLKHIGR